MIDFAPLVLLMAAVILYSAWYEYRSKNSRDAKLLAGVGLGGLVASSALFFS